MVDKEPKAVVYMSHGLRLKKELELVAVVVWQRMEGVLDIVRH